MTIHPFIKDNLQKLSREGKPKKTVSVGGRLHDSNLGSIYFVYYNDKPEDSYVMKSIDLNDQNIYCIAINTKRTTLRGTPSNDILFKSESKTETKLWQETWCTHCNCSDARKNSVVAKISYLEGPSIDRDGATSVVYVNEYLNEAIVGIILRTTLRQTIPNFVWTHEAWIQNATGLILQDYGGSSLRKLMPSLSLPAFQSLVLQVLCALSVAQQKTHFKHHDMHLENMFVNPTEGNRELETTFPKASKALTWSYPLKTSNGQSFSINVPMHGYFARIGDYGLASCTEPNTKTRFERADYDLLDAGETEWGSWNGRLDGNLSYDMITFLCSFFLEDDMKLCPKPHALWAQHVYMQALHLLRQRNQTVECSLIGRPFRNQEGNLPIADLLYELEIVRDFRTDLPKAEIEGNHFVFPIA